MSDLVPQPESDSQPWYQPAAALKDTNPDVWQSFENGVKSGSIKDLSSLIVKGISAEKKLGGALIPPGQNAKPEELAAFKAKLYQSGVIKAPPESPDKYEIQRPETIPENLWSAELEGKAREWAHKHGIPQEAMAELMQLEGERFAGLAAALAEQKEEFVKTVDGVAKEMNVEAQALVNGVDNWLSRELDDETFTFMKERNMLTNPGVFKVFARAAIMSGEDISLVGGDAAPSGAKSAEAEFNDIINNKDNPRHAKFFASDPEAVEYVNGLMRKAWPGETNV